MRLLHLPARRGTDDDHERTINRALVVIRLFHTAVIAAADDDPAVGKVELRCPVDLTFDIDHGFG